MSDYYDIWDEDEDDESFAYEDRGPYRWIPKEIPDGEVKVIINSQSFKTVIFTSKAGNEWQLILLPVLYQNTYRFDAAFVSLDIATFSEKYNKGDEVSIYVFYSADGVKRANVIW